MAGMRTATLSILEDVEETRKELAKSNRLKDLFMDIMRHDLLNPAGIVRINSQLALSEEEDVEKKKLLEPIERQSNRMIRMIENASILAKLESGEKIDFAEEDLGVMLKGSVEELSERSKEKGMVVRVVVDGKFPAQVNPLIQNVFSNFLSNAIKYCPEKTEIIAGIKSKENDWLVYVEDRGEGIPAEYKKAVFDRFTRLEKGAIKGSGLGLAISKKIAEAHGGKIWVGDHKGGGSIFYALVPKKHVEVAKPAVKSVGARIPSKPMKKVVGRLIKGVERQEAAPSSEGKKKIIEQSVKKVEEKPVEKNVIEKSVKGGKVDKNG
jgi:signal transduction histidine kinase